MNAPMPQAADRLPFVLPKHWTRVQLFQAVETHVCDDSGEWRHDEEQSTESLQVQLDRWQDETRHLVVSVASPTVTVREVIPERQVMYIRSLSVVYVPATEANHDPRKPVPGVGYAAIKPPAGLRGRVASRDAGSTASPAAEA